MLLRALACLAILSATPILAAPAAYRLDAERSVVGFTYDFEGREQQGQMPVLRAEITLDLENVTQSAVDVTLDVTGARAGFIFATEAMKSAKVLDAARYPTIRFRASSINGSLARATVRGELTIRGITRPVTLQAGLYRPLRSDPGDLDSLLIRLTGDVSRSAFGADGFPDYVGDRIGLDIFARIEK